MTRTAVALLLGALLTVAPALPAQGQGAALISTAWEQEGLRVSWTLPAPGCLHLAGRLPLQRLVDIPCAATGEALLRTSGVDAAYAPQLRTSLELRSASDLSRVLAQAPIPARYSLVLPLIAMARDE